MSAVVLTVLSFGFALALGEVASYLRHKRKLSNLQRIDRLARKR